MAAKHYTDETLLKPVQTLHFPHSLNKDVATIQTPKLYVESLKSQQDIYPLSV